MTNFESNIAARLFLILFFPFFNHRVSKKMFHLKKNHTFKSLKTTNINKITQKAAVANIRVETIYK